MGRKRPQAAARPPTNRSHAYVAMTRGREANHAWIPDPTGELDSAHALEAALGRSDDRTLALATLDRLHLVAGRPVPAHDLTVGHELAVDLSAEMMGP